MKLRRFLTETAFVPFAQANQPGGALEDENGASLCVFRDVAAAIDPTFDLEGSQDRTIPYVFSTEAVARDGHTVSITGFDLTGFNANPVFLWAHDSSQPPVGKVTDLTRASGVMRGVVEYAERDLYPFADMIFRMVKKRFLNAVSISWLPIDWKFSTDRNRVGGIDFTRQDLLEISQVPVPAQISALATARAAGIDTSPMVEWAERMLDGGSKILLPREEVERLRAAAKMPTVKRGAAAGVTVVGPAVKRKFSRDLYQVGELANVLMWLDWIKDYAEWEKEIEGDDSDIPDRLLKSLQDLGAILKDMTIEEVNELLEMEGEEETVLEVTLIEQSAKTPAQRAILRLASIARAANAHNARKFVVRSSQMITAEQRQILGRQVREFLGSTTLPVLALDGGMQFEEITRDEALPIRAIIEKRVRAGRVLSASNEAALRQACDLIEGVVAQAGTQTEEQPAAEVTEVAQSALTKRKRQAEALALAESAH